MRMKTILVDDEETATQVFCYQIRGLALIQIDACFHTGEDALDYVKVHPVDLAILDIQLGDMDGIMLGAELQKIYPDILLIYITGYEEYALKAIQLHAAAYLTKPYSQNDLLYAIDTARLLSKRTKHRIFAKTFGHFDLFVDGEPIMFKSAKAKELLALLIDRQGGTVTTDQIIGVLWEERPNDEATQNLCSKISRTLKQELQSYGVEEILITYRGTRRIDSSKLECDLYDLLAGDNRAAERFIGEYMLEYSWAEDKMALLDKYIF